MYSDRKEMSDCLGEKCRDRQEERIAREHEVPSVGDENVHYPTVMMVSWVYVDVKTYEIVHFKYV